MKRILYTFIMALTLLGCAKHGTDDEFQKEDTISFGAAKVTGTRTSYEDNGSIIATSWNEGDKIGVFATASSESICANKPYVADRSGKTTGFTPSDMNDIKWVKGGAHDFYAYYPYSETSEDLAKVNLSIPSVQTVYSSNLYKEFSKYDFLIARIKGAAQTTDSVKLEFSHTVSFIEINLSCDEEAAIKDIKVSSETGDAIAFENGTINLETGAIDVSEAEKSNTVSIEGGFRLAPSKVLKVPVVLTPGHAGKKFTISASVNGVAIDIAERTVPSSGLEAGRVAVIDSKVTPTVPEPVIDLSENGTANSYYVSTAGTRYCFDVTKKGNGIAKTVGGISYTDADLTIDPKALLVLWYNCVQIGTEWVDRCPVTISSLTLEGGKAYFRTSPEFVAGNVVIIALDQALDYDEVEATDNMITNADILWSWNIIAAENYTPDKNAVTIGDVTFMSRDLGAVIDAKNASNSVEIASALGNVYQWGRKDPFPCPSSYDFSLTGLIFTPTYTPIPALSRGTVANNGTALNNQIFGATIDATGTTAPYFDNANTFAQGVEHAVKNPHIYYYQADDTPSGGSSFYHSRWFSTAGTVYRSAWGEATGKAATNKTIYDPCPPGWKLVSNTDWHTMIDNGHATLALEASGKGITVNGLTFPIHPLLSNTGWRKEINDGTTAGTSEYYCSTGGWYIVNMIYGNYLSRYGFIKKDATRADYVKYNDTYYSMSLSYVNGMPVRCVRE